MVKCKPLSKDDYFIPPKRGAGGCNKESIIFSGFQEAAFM